MSTEPDCDDGLSSGTRTHPRQTSETTRPCARPRSAIPRDTKAPLSRGARRRYTKRMPTVANGGGLHRLMTHIRGLTRLRMHRRQWRLTLRELAQLLGFRSGAHVSRLEQGKRTPSLETALACTAIFGVPLQELFPESVRHARTRTKVRAMRFRKGHEKRSTTTAKRKCEFIEDVLLRLGEEPQTIEA